MTPQGSEGVTVGSTYFARSRRAITWNLLSARYCMYSSNLLVRILGAAAAACELDAEVFEERQGVALDGVARVGETDRDGDSVLLALHIDPSQLGGQVAHCIA